MPLELKQAKANKNLGRVVKKYLNILQKNVGMHYAIAIAYKRPKLFLKGGT